MIFLIKKTSDIKEEDTYHKEINTLEELLEFKKEIGKPLILLKDCNEKGEKEYILEIYDDYRE